MALVWQNINVNLDSSLVPSGYTKPSFTEVTDPNYDTVTYTETVVKSTVENATEATTLTNIVNALDTAIQAKLNNDYDVAANTVTAYAELYNINSNFKPGDAFYTNTAVSFYCYLRLYVKIS